MSDVALRATGRIKWFDSVKGFGFLVCDDVDGDILVHASRLREHGRKYLPDGTLCDVEYEMGQRGWQATRVLNIDITDACFKPIPQRGPKSTSFKVEPGPFEPCEIKSFSRIRGYGFLIREQGGGEAFVHMETLRKSGIDDLRPGFFIHARIGDTPKGPMAVELRDGR